MRQSYRDGERTRAVEVARESDGRFRVRVEDGEIALAAEALGDGLLRLYGPAGASLARVTLDGAEVWVTLAGRDYRFEKMHGGRRGAVEHAEGEISMPMPGVVVQVHVAEGESVTRGQPLVVVEAMKMEHVLKAPRDGTVQRLAARAGELVDAGKPLLEVAAG